MNRFRLATWATLLGVALAEGCASPCGGCGGGVFQRMSMFRARRACPCECCSSCGDGGPFVGGGPDFGDGPLLEPPGAPFAGAPPLSAIPPAAGGAVPEPMPSLGTPFGTVPGAPAVPVDPSRLNPVPNGAQPFSAGPSSRVRSR